MIARILESPVIDILLILLAIRFIAPRLFTVKKVVNQKPADRIIIVNKQEPEKKKADKAGEYVDYEEIK